MGSVGIYFLRLLLQCLILASHITAKEFMSSVEVYLFAPLSLLKQKENYLSIMLFGSVSPQPSIRIASRKHRPRLALAPSSSEIPDVKQVVTATHFPVLWNQAGDNDQLGKISFIFRLVPNTKLTEE